MLTPVPVKLLLAEKSRDADSATPQEMLQQFPPEMVVVSANLCEHCKSGLVFVVERGEYEQLLHDDAGRQQLMAHLLGMAAQLLGAQYSMDVGVAVPVPDPAPSLKQQAARYN